MCCSKTLLIDTLTFTGIEHRNRFSNHLRLTAFTDMPSCTDRVICLGLSGSLAYPIPFSLILCITENINSKLIYCGWLCVPDWLGSTLMPRSSCSMTQRSSSLDGFGENYLPSQTSWTLYAATRPWFQVQGETQSYEQGGGTIYPYHKTTDTHSVSGFLVCIST